MLIRVRRPCSRDAVSVDEMSRSSSCSDDVPSRDASTPGYVDVWGVESSIDGIGMVAMERSPSSANETWQAWNGVHLDMEQSDALKRRGETALDLEELLPQADLSDLDTMFW